MVQPYIDVSKKLPATHSLSTTTSMDCPATVFNTIATDIDNSGSEPNRLRVPMLGALISPDITMNHTITIERTNAHAKKKEEEGCDRRRTSKDATCSTRYDSD